MQPEQIVSFSVAVAYLSLSGLLGALGAIFGGGQAKPEIAKEADVATAEHALPETNENEGETPEVAETADIAAGSEKGKPAVEKKTAKEAAIRESFDDAKTQIDSLAKATGASVELTKPMAVNLTLGAEPSPYGYGRSTQPKRQPDGGYELVATSPTEGTVSGYAMSKHK